MKSFNGISRRWGERKISPIRQGIVKLTKSVSIGLLMGVSFSYFLVSHYVDLGNYFEVILVALVVSLMSGLVLQNMNLLLIAEAVSITSAILIASSTLAYSIFIPFIRVSSVELLLLTIYFTGTSVIGKTFVTIFFLIPPIILLFGILGVFLSENLTE